VQNRPANRYHRWHDAGTWYSSGGGLPKKSIAGKLTDCEWLDGAWLTFTDNAEDSKRLLNTNAASSTAGNGGAVSVVTQHGQRSWPIYGLATSANGLFVAALAKYAPNTPKSLRNTDSR
jgi:hypothetical protein